MVTEQSIENTDQFLNKFEKNGNTGKRKKKTPGYLCPEYIETVFRTESI
jgi:hypothetical protein